MAKTKAGLLMKASHAPAARRNTPSMCRCAGNKFVGRVSRKVQLRQEKLKRQRQALEEGISCSSSSISSEDPIKLDPRLACINDLEALREQISQLKHIASTCMKTLKTTMQQVVTCEAGILRAKQDYQRRMTEV